MAYVTILRPVNLLLLLLTQILIKFGLFAPLGVKTAMSTFDFGLLVLATVCIAAAGNIINDIHDVAIDRINKPEKVLVGKKISEKTAYNYYIILNVIGVGAGFLLANRIGHPGLAAVFIAISVLLYSYATYLTSVFVVGNVIVSILVATSLVVLIIFDIYPAVTTDEMEVQLIASKTILWYALAAFYLNLIREIVKDVIDINGDKKGERNTLPIILGRTRTRTIVFVMGVIALTGLLYFSYEYAYHSQLLGSYLIFMVGVPLLYFCIQTWNAEKQTDYKRLSNTLKIIMFCGVISIVFYQHLILGT